MAPSQAFVPGCTHDIFVSYAHVDDQPAPGATTGWVTTLVRGLETLLAQRLGRSDAYSLWMDHDLSRHVQITPEILRNLEKTATLLIVLSPGYLASEWCRREREAFFAMVREKIEAGSGVFVVERMKLDSEERAPELAELLGYRFWVADREGHAPRTLGVPAPVATETEYYDRLNDLSHDLAKELKRLRGAQSAPESQATTSTSGSTVFLAEVTDDIDDLRNDTRRYLDQTGIPVLPDIYYSRDPAAFRTAMEKDLAECKLFVQLLSALPGKRTPELPQGYVGLQHQVAQEEKVPVLQWRSRELDLDAVRDAEHRARLSGQTVQSVGIEDFKKAVVEAALRKETPRRRSMNAFVFVDTEQEDRSLADSVCHALDEEGVGYALPLRTGEPADLRKDLEQNILDCDALVIMYGNSSASWVRSQLQYMRKVVQARERPLKALAIYEGPPPDKVPVDYKLPIMQTLDGRAGINMDNLRQFLDAAQDDSGT